MRLGKQKNRKKNPPERRADEGVTSTFTSFYFLNNNQPLIQ